MKHPLIHRGFFRESFRQLRAKGLIATLLLMSLNLILFLTFLTRDPVNSSVSHYDARLMALPMLLILYVMGPILVFGAYRWLNRRVQSDFYHAIPLTRTQLFATTSAAIFAWLLIALGAFAAVHAILFAVFGLPFNYLLYLCVFLNMLIAAIEIVAAFSIGSALSGRRFPAFFQSVAILFLPRLLLSAFWILTEVDSGFTLPFSQLAFFLNPEFNIAATPFHSLIYGINYANVPAMLYSFAYSVLLLALGGVAFKKRRSETAELPYASRVLQTATRVMFGLPSLAAIVVILNLRFRYGSEQTDFLTTSSLLPLIATSVIFSFIFYCLYELISSRKMKKVVKAMPAFGFCIALALLFIFVPGWIGKLRKPQPVTAETVRSYRFSNESTLIVPNRIASEETYPDYVLHHHTFREESAKTLIEAMQKANIAYAEEDSDWLDFLSDRVIVKDGGLFQKTVDLPDRTTAANQLMKTCMDDPAFTEKLFAYPKGRITYVVTGLTQQEAQEVGRLFREDYGKLTEEQRRSLITSYNSVFDIDRKTGPVGLSIMLLGSYGTENYTMYCRVNELTPNAAKAMLGYLNARNEAAVRERLKELVAWMEQPDRSVSAGIFSIGTYSLDRWALWNENEKGSPKSAHPEAYRILKALSEAPLTTDPAHCATVSVRSYETGVFSVSINTVGVVGFEIDENLKNLILQWIGDVNDSYDPSDFGSI